MLISALNKEAARLEALARYALLDAPPEPEFEQTAALANGGANTGDIADWPINLRAFLRAINEVLAARVPIY